MANKIQLRRDTTSNWNRINPILADGEPGLNITTNQIKYGDGTTAWNDLAYSGTDPTRLVSGEAVVALASDGKISAPGFDIDGTGNFSAIYSNFNAPSSAKAILVSPSDGDTGLMLPPDSQTDIEAVRLYNVNATGTVKVTTNTGAQENNWTFGSSGTLFVPPAEVTITSRAGTDATPLNISNISVTITNLVEITTSANHGITQNGTKVKITGLTRCTQLNNGFYYVWPGALNTFVLFEDVDLNLPVNPSILTEPYSAAGNRQTTSTSVQTTSDQSPFVGEQSIGFYGNSSYIQVAPSNDFDFGLGPFTVSFWVYQSSYGTYSRLFSFGTWPSTTFGMSSESSSTTTTWINGTQIGDGLGGLSLNAWHYVVITRFENMISISIDGVKGNTFNGLGYDLTLATTKTLTIGNQGALDAGLTGYIRDFKINVGEGLDVTTLSDNLPTGPATADASTKLLLLASYADVSGSSTVTGGGAVTELVPSADINITTSSSTNDSDYGDIYVSAGMTSLKVDGVRNRVVMSDPGGDYPINSTGQNTIEINADSETTPIDATTARWVNNVYYIKPADGYSPSGTHTIQIPIPDRPGVEITIINDTPAAVNIADWDGPIQGMSGWENIKMTSYRDSLGDIWWWVTGSYSW